MAEGSSENDNRDDQGGGDTGAMQLADSSGNYTAARAASASQQIALNGGVAVTGSGANPYPDMPKVSATRPLLRSLGATGTAIFNGVVTSEEYNEDFYWKDAIRIYETMLRNDAQVNAVRLLCELPIRRATWSLEPASDDPVDVEIASFVESCLFHEMRYVTSTGRTLTQKWDDTLRHILLMLWYGFSAFEQVWRIEDGWVKWARWLPLLPRTIWRWWVGEDNELVGIQQWTFKQYNYQFINIPADKLLLFVHRQEGQNYEGLSLLRTAYKHWWYKDNFYKIEAIDIERNAIPTPVIHLPENFTDQDVTNATSMLANIRANESMGLTLPPGWSAEYLNAHGSSRGGPGSQMTPSIEHHDLMIARNVLGQFMNLGSDATGSYALASTQVDMFLNALQATCEYIEDVINLDAIPRLVDYNYDGVSVYPKLKASKLALQDIQGIATMLKDLAGQQPLITPGPELEDWIRSELGVPTAPASPVESENPSDESDLGNGEDEESSTVQGKAAPESPENTEDAEGVAGGDAADAGAEMSAGGGLTAESRLLREALDAAYGRWDAVERAMVFAGGGGGHEAGYSQNRDAHGRWAPGDGGEGGDRSSSGAGGAGGAEGNARGGAKGSSSASPKGGSRGSRGGGGAAKGGAKTQTPAAEKTPRQARQQKGSAKAEAASAARREEASMHTQALVKREGAARVAKTEAKAAKKSEDGGSKSKTEGKAEDNGTARAEDENVVHQIRADQVHVGLNPREHFDTEQIKELAQSIKENGLLQPITVRPHENGYQIIAGERRFRAMQSLGYEHVPAIVRNVDDAKARELALIENINRVDMRPSETAKAYQALADRGMTAKEIADLTGKSEGHIQQHLDLLTMEPHLQTLVDKEQLPLGVVREMAKLSPAGREEAAARIIAGDLGVRSAKQLVRSIAAREHQISMFPESRNLTKHEVDAKARYEDAIKRITEALGGLDDETMRGLSRAVDSPFRESERLDLMIKQLRRMQNTLDFAGHARNLSPDQGTAAASESVAALRVLLAEGLAAATALLQLREARGRRP